MTCEYASARVAFFCVMASIECSVCNKVPSSFIRAVIYSLHLLHQTSPFKRRPLKSKASQLDLSTTSYSQGKASLSNSPIE